MELEPKTLKTLVIISFVLSVFAIIFSMISLWMDYDGSTILDHKEFNGLHHGIKKLYRKVMLSKDGVLKPYIEVINTNYEKAIDQNGGEEKFNDEFTAAIKKYMDTHPIVKSFK
jgi:hypothetical protein